MITVDSFFSGTLNTVDAVIGDFVSNAYINFIQANTSVITMLFTVYVMMIGYQFLSHNHHFDLSIVIKRLIVMLCVYVLWSTRLYHWQFDVCLCLTVIYLRQDDDGGFACFRAALCPLFYVGCNKGLIFSLAE